MNSLTTSNDAYLEHWHGVRTEGAAAQQAQLTLSAGSSSARSRLAGWSVARWFVSVLAVSAWASAASAQGKVVTIAEVTIVGRVQKPIAAVDVSRIQPQMTLAELRQPFLDRIEKAVYRAPF